MEVSGHLRAMAALTLGNDAPAHVGLEAVYTPEPVRTFWERGTFFAPNHSASSVVTLPTKLSHLSQSLVL
jgi:hypothetical protein